MRNKKTMIGIIGVVALAIVIIDVTYAYWRITRFQTNDNIIVTKCLNISLVDELNDINLTNQEPIKNEEGMQLTPYTFSVSNNCNDEIYYQINLETLGFSSTSIKTSAIKIALNDNISLLSNKSKTATLNTVSSDAYLLKIAKLSASGTEGDKDSYELRVWIDENAPVSEANKTFKSKISVFASNQIKMPYQEGTLAFDILSNYGGLEQIKEIDQDVKGARFIKSGPIYVGSTEVYFGSSYYVDASGNLGLNYIKKATIDECRNKPDFCYPYTRLSATSGSTGLHLYKITDFYSSEGAKYVTGNTYVNTTFFGGVTEYGEEGVYKTTDDLGDSYYFRGASENNYVKFGSYPAGSVVDGVTYEEEIPMYWRIVRINGDGTIRIIYDGTSPVANGVTHNAVIGKSYYNSDSTDKKYVGYTYDTSDTDNTQVNSLVKDKVDNWYETYLKANYETYIADGIFCNDRAYDESTTNFAARDRLWSNKNPKLTCENKEDRYAMSTEIGNGLLTNPIGLLSLDEAYFAGSTANNGNFYLDFSNKNYYLFSGNMIWTLTPNRNTGNTSMWYIGGGGLASVSYTSYNSDAGAQGYNLGIRPVINLKADVKFTGTGTINNPYEIVME